MLIKNGPLIFWFPSTQIYILALQNSVKIRDKAPLKKEYTTLLYTYLSLYNAATVSFQGDALRSSLLSRYYGANYYIMISQAVTKSSTDNNSKKSASQLVNSGPGAEMLSRAGVTLCEMQGRLDKCGASDLIIDLIMKQPNHRVFLEILELAIALLEGGNSSIQVGNYRGLQTP